MKQLTEVKLLSSRKSTRKSRSKIVDKWKEKSWYQVMSPGYIVEKSLGETPASDPELLPGRVIEMAKLGVLKDMFNDINLKIRFRITTVEGNICRTEFAGHEVAKEQIRSQIRRNRSKIESIQNVLTKDKARLRVSSIVITPMRCGTSTQKIVRKTIGDLIKVRAREQILLKKSKKQLTRFFL
jgi:small subunit ribosomal protein S3Ae